MDPKSLVWVKPALYGAACGAAAVAFVGFHWGGWVTEGRATALANTSAQAAVVAALTPICLDMARRDPDYAAKLADLRKASSYSRSELVVKAGWGTTLGTDAINESVARTCAEKLLL